MADEAAYQDVLETKRKEGVKRVAWLCAAIAFFGVLGLLLVKWIFKPDLPVGKMLLWAIIIVLFFSGIAVGFHYYSKHKAKKRGELPEQQHEGEKLPAAITVEGARALADKLLADAHWEYFQGGCPIDGSGYYGKSGKVQIYTKV